MTWKLFLDDERWPKDPSNWVISRSSFDAIRECEDRNCLPQEIAFDHDLGGDDTAIRFICWMAGALMDEKFSLPENFQFSVHSQNPVGAKNIKEYMQNLVYHFGK